MLRQKSRIHGDINYIVINRRDTYTMHTSNAAKSVYSRRMLRKRFREAAAGMVISVPEQFDVNEDEDFVDLLPQAVAIEAGIFNGEGSLRHGSLDASDTILQVTNTQKSILNMTVSRLSSVFQVAFAWSIKTPRKGCNHSIGWNLSIFGGASLPLAILPGLDPAKRLSVCMLLARRFTVCNGDIPDDLVYWRALLNSHIAVNYKRKNKKYVFAEYVNGPLDPRIDEICTRFLKTSIICWSRDFDSARRNSKDGKYAIRTKDEYRELILELARHRQDDIKHGDLYDYRWSHNVDVKKVLETSNSIRIFDPYSNPFVFMS